MLKDDPRTTDVGLDPERLFQASPEAVVVLRDGVIVRATDRMAALLGADPTGAPIRDLVPDWRDGPDAAVPYDATLDAPDGSTLSVEV
ncbi:MAG TPA: PAS domain-containing protein, partial [Actinomycetota bacterium]